jgi:hypothetical protein
MREKVPPHNSSVNSINQLINEREGRCAREAPELACGRAGFARARARGLGGARHTGAGAGTGRGMRGERERGGSVPL